MKLVLHFSELVMVERFGIVAHSFGLKPNVTHDGRYKVTVECPDKRTKAAVVAAWSRASMQK
jgi:hypothetical protein